jgi:hypothetical protein
MVARVTDRRAAPLLLASTLALVACQQESKKAPEPVEAPEIGALRSGQKSSQAASIVRSLTDEVGPRLAGSPGDALATAWGERTMKSLGFANVRLEPVRVPHWVRGAESGKVVSPVEQQLSLTALGGSIGTPEGGLEGEVVMAASLDALAKLPDDAVRGKIVFIDIETKATKTGEGYGASVGTRSGGASAAAKKGAIGFLVRSIATSKARLPHTGAMRYDDAVPKIPAAALAVPDAMMLHRLIESSGKPVRVSFSLGCQKLEDVMSANVVKSMRELSCGWSSKHSRSSRSAATPSARCASSCSRTKRRA